jgi:DivIVA domain-containing protein
MPEPQPFRTAFRGYDPEQVDALLARCARTLGERARELPAVAWASHLPVSDTRPVTALEVEQVQFRVRFRGYQLQEVDDLLDQVAARLQRP